ncbi:metalloregulator ArsR/SmtB family transcription factor [Streptomyces sp. NPDC004959]|uniref:ArsR/SmtB family transcription factor n=1 Tax=unclassified Streptomyces TaxID=2593676 RepID=UPI000ABD1BDD
MSGDGSGFAGDPPAEALDAAATVFGLLASPARLHLVWALAGGESDVTRLAQRLGGALPAVSQHLTKLKLGGVVGSRREGRRQVYYLRDPRIVELVGALLAPGSEAPALPERSLGA